MEEFKKDFIFGTATSSFQIEGATRSGGRIPSIWDQFCATPGKIRNGDNGDVACEHFQRFKEDIALLKELGVDAYRFSIAWPRVLDADGNLLTEGVAFYREILLELQKEGIKAFVTLYHWDLPQWMEERGGWLNRETAYRFADYAALMVKEYHGLVTGWATLNEPFCSAYLGYGIGIHAPGLKNLKYAVQAGHHLLLAHGLAVQKIREVSPDEQLGIVLNVTPGYPVSEKEEDIRASRLFDAFNLHWFFQPLFNKQYHNDLFEIWPNCEPIYLAEDFEIIATRLDFLGINYYTRSQISSDGKHIFEEMEIENKTDMGWEIYPEGLRDVLLTLSNQYELPPIYITENGMADKDEIHDGRINDERRVLYLNDHLEAVADAKKRGVDVRGYFAWSLLDNFEWAEGYSKRFGLYYVDFESQERTPKDSALWYKNFIKSLRS